jgi:hypothetical protein
VDTRAVKSVVAVLLLAAAARAADLNLALGRDVLYQPGSQDSAVMPAVALLGAGLRLGSIGSLKIRAGYSEYWSVAGIAELPEERGVMLRGVRLQVIPGVRITTPYEPVSVYGGVGLGGRTSSLHDSNHRGEIDVRDQSLWAFDQTFLLGVGVELSRRFGLDVEAERLGFSAGYSLTREYHEYSGFNDPIEVGKSDHLDIGWRGRARTGIAVGLRLKL